MTRLAVLGSPIAHSLSPALHRAAYAELGLDWTYDALELEARELGGFLEGLDAEWRGLSLTMPHKRVVLGLVDELDPVGREVGAANTVLLRDGRRLGFNTDVAGIVGALGDHGVHQIGTATILGGGATAASALGALAALGAVDVLVGVRDPARAESLGELGAALGVEVVIRPLLMQDRSLRIPDVVVSTLPGHAEVELPVFPEVVRRGAALLDVAYDPWPTPLATAWTDAGGRVARGLEMLLHQAVAQVRVFVAGDPGAVLPDEARVVAAMRAAVGLGPASLEE